jgi:uncharacterized membrane protein (UPF0127 family)
VFGTVGILCQTFQKDIKPLKTPFCAFNISRQSFLSLGVTVADTQLARMRGLLGKMRMRSDEAVWIVPSQGIHTLGLRFTIDVVYLDGQQRVVHTIENLRPLRIAGIRWQCASVLELPARSICGSGTQVGDQLLICSPEKMRDYWASASGAVEGNAVQARAVKGGTAS